MTTVKLHGVGLHSGQEVTLELVEAKGPVQFERDGVPRPIGAFHVSRTHFATSIACDAFELHTVEHLLAALAGLGVRSGLRIVVRGGTELPLLDGGAAEYARVLSELHPRTSAPRLRVARRERITEGRSVYELEPGEVPRVVVSVELPASCAPDASWDGDPDQFIDRIASARTFAVESDIDALAERGLVQHVDPRSVLIVGEDEIRGAGAIKADEPARHKLLDLLGDAYLYGGPPRGTLRATRPGHTHNHAALLRALETGAVVRDPT